MSSIRSQYITPTANGSIPAKLQDVLDVFSGTQGIGLPGCLKSNEVLAAVKKALEEKKFKTSVPVKLDCIRHTGRKKGFNIDAVWQDENTKVYVEVEAGRTIANNAYILDLMKAIACNVSHLVLAVPRLYRKTDEPFEKVVAFVQYLMQKTLLKQGSLKGVLVIGYGPAKTAQPRIVVGGAANRRRASSSRASNLRGAGGRQHGH